MVGAPELVLFVGVVRIDRAGEEENTVDVEFEVEFEDCPAAKGSSNSSSNDLIATGRPI